MEIYPYRIAELRLDFDWDPFERVDLFVTDHFYADVIAWYSKRSPAAEIQAQSDGQFEAYYPDRVDPERSILLADLSLEDPILNLDAYIGSSLVIPLAKRPGARVFGAFFIHRNENRA